MKSFLRIVLVLGMALLVSSGLVSAQNAAVTFCGDLSEADCALVQESQALMAELESSSFTLNMDMSISGIPEMPDGIAFNLTGSGSSTVDQAALAPLTDMKPEDMASDPMAIFNVLAKAIPAVGADLQFALTLPESLREEMGSEVTLPETLKISLKLVDGVVYVNAEELAEYVPQMKGAAGWMGIDLADLLNVALSQPGFSESLSGMNGMSGMGMNTDLMNAFSDPESLGTMLKIARLSDGDVNGTTVAVFETTLDYAAMMSMPAMQDLMKQQFEATGGEMTEAQMEEMMSMIQTMGENIKLTVQQHIDPATKYLLQTNVSMTFDMGPVMAAAGESSDGAAPLITLDMTIGQSDFNGVAPITKPDGAFLIPLNGMSQAS